jgi:hypothetical protein
MPGEKPHVSILLPAALLLYQPTPILMMFFSYIDAKNAKIIIAFYENRTHI